MSDKQELNMEEMGQVAGGWTFHSNGKYHTWLDGYEIKCPYCGNTSADVVKRIGACVKSFYLRWDSLNKKVYLVKK